MILIIYLYTKNNNLSEKYSVCKKMMIDEIVIYVKKTIKRDCY